MTPAKARTETPVGPSELAGAPELEANATVRRSQDADASQRMLEIVFASPTSSPSAATSPSSPKRRSPILHISSEGTVVDVEVVDEGSVVEDELEVVDEQAPARRATAMI